MRLWSLGDAVGAVAVVLLLVLETLGAVRLLVGGKVRCGGTEGLGRKHRTAHHGHLVGIGLELSTVCLHLVARELLVKEHVSDAVLCRDVVVQLAVEQPRGRLQMGIQPLVLGGQVIILLFVHLLVDDILLGDTQCTAGTLLVDLRSATGRLNAGLQAAVTSARSSDVGTGGASARRLCLQLTSFTYRSWFSSWVRSVFTGFAVGKVARRSAGMVRGDVGLWRRRQWWRVRWSGASSSLGREGANGLEVLELHRYRRYVLGTMQL